MGRGFSLVLRPECLNQKFEIISINFHIAVGNYDTDIRFPSGSYEKVQDVGFSV